MRKSLFSQPCFQLHFWSYWFNGDNFFYRANLMELIFFLVLYLASLNKPNSQSSLAFKGYAHLGFDGKIDRITHTSQSPHFTKVPVWIKVDLQQNLIIDSVKIFNRRGGTMSRLRNASISFLMIFWWNVVTFVQHLKA